MKWNTLSITTYIGIGFMVLAALTGDSIINLTPQFLFSISLAGFLFILFDFFSSDLNVTDSRVEKWIVDKLRAASLFASIMSIVVLPYFPLNISNERMQHINNTLVLYGLGFVIVTIGLREAKGLIGHFNKLEKETKKVIKNMNELEEKVTALEDNLANPSTQQNNES